LITNLDGLEESLKSSRSFALDLETTGLDFMTDRIVIVAITTNDGTWAIPLIGKNAVSFIDMRDVLEPIFENTSKTMYCWNGKFDLNFLRANGFDPKNKFMDGMVGSYVLDTQLARQRGKLKLSWAVKDIMGIDLNKSITKEFINIKELMPHHLQYAGLDAHTTFNVCEFFLGKLRKIPELYKIFTKISMPLLPILSQMELNGVSIDIDHFSVIGDELRKDIDNELKTIRKFVGNININSDPQLSKVLFEGDNSILKVIPKHLRNKDSSYSVAAGELENYSHPVIDSLLAYKKKTTLMSTFIKPMGKKTKASPDGRLRGNFNQANTKTSRLSSSSPNLQNVPTKKGYLRKAFIAPPGKKLIVADFKQIEYRTIGYMAMKEFGKSNIAYLFMVLDHDLHEVTRKQMDDRGIVGFSTDCPEARKHAKQVNFRFMYGSGAKSYSREYDVSLSDAIAMRSEFHNSKPELEMLKNICVSEISSKGYVKTITGRRLQFQNCKGLSRNENNWPGWVALNAKNQGSAQEIIKIAMIKIDKSIKTNCNANSLWGDVNMLLQIHDELVFEVPESIAEEAVQLINNDMSHAVVVPEMKFPVDSKICDNWEEGK